jgi:hypothetical protein
MFSIPIRIKMLVFDEVVRPATANSVAGFIHSSGGCSSQSLILKHLPVDPKPEPHLRNPGWRDTKLLSGCTGRFAIGQHQSDLSEPPWEQSQPRREIDPNGRGLGRSSPSVLDDHFPPGPSVAVEMIKLADPKSFAVLSNL